MSDSSATVLVIGTDFKAGPWAVRSLRAGGFTCVGAHARGRLAGGRSRWCPRPLRHPHPARDPLAFLDWVCETAARTGAAAVLATTEEATQLLALHDRDLGGALFVGPTAGQYRALCDKGALGVTAAQAGVDHPAQYAVEDDTDLETLPLPAVVKARDSGEAVDRLGRAIICPTAALRDESVGRMFAAGGRPLVQELLVGPRWNFHGVALAAGVRGFATQVIREYPRGRGITSLARSATPPPAFLEVVTRLVEQTGYRGPISVQVIQRESGSFAVHDVNLRLPASVGLTIRAGLDLPRLAVQDALGIPVGPLPVAPLPVAYLGVDGEVAAFRDSLRHRNGESARQVLGTARRVLRGHRPVIDPNPADPFWLTTIGARRVMTRVRTSVRRG